MNRAFNDYLRKLNVDPKNARKAQVPYDKGTVNFFVLDAGATNGELISAPCPSLFGNNSAIFSAKLTPSQAVILEAAFTQAKAPAAVAYNLSFTGITPALKVEVTAQFESIYKEFDLKFGANIPIPVETPASFWLGFDSVIKTAAGSETGDQGHRKHAGRRRGQRERVGTAVRQGRDLEKLFSATLKPNDDSNPQAKSASDAILDSLIASDKKEGEEAGKGGLFPSASLEIKLVRIEETKSLNFNYTSSKALSQSAVPQNFIGSDILHAQKTAPYFIQVNVNDPFFQQLDLTVLGPDSFEEYGIKATTFNIRYNHQVYTAAPFTKDDGT